MSLSRGKANHRVFYFQWRPSFQTFLGRRIQDCRVLPDVQLWHPFFFPLLSVSRLQDAYHTETVENLQATIIQRRSRPFRGKCCLLHRHQPSSDGRKYGRHFWGWKQCRLRANYTQSSHWTADCWVLLLRTWEQRKVLSERGSPIDSVGYTVAVTTGPLKLGAAEERIKKCLWDHSQRRTLGGSGKRMRLDAVKPHSRIYDPTKTIYCCQFC